MGHGWERGERERQRGVWCVLNCICLTFWHVQHRLKITFAAEKCRTIRWRRQSVEWIATGDWKRKEEGGVGRDYMVTQRSTDKIDNWQMQSEHLGALICVPPSLLSLLLCLAVNCISSKHFCGCFWQNKETLEKWPAISLDKLSICRLFSRLRRSSTWDLPASLQVSRGDSSSSASIGFVARCLVLSRHFKPLMDFMSSSKFIKIIP